MSDEQKPHGEKEHFASDTTEHNDQKETAKLQSTMLLMLLGFVVIVGVGMLLVTMGRNAGAKGAAKDTDEIKEASAEVKALREELNRKRAELGLRPLEGGGETVEEISKRIKRDADTMVSLAGSFQSLLAEKDAEISAKNGELIRSEQLRQTLTTETSRLQTELQKALVSSSEGDALRRSLDTMTAQRDALAKQLASLREELAKAKVPTVSDAEIENLRDRAEEAARAKAFFEKRVAELEAELAKTRLFAKSETELFPAAVLLFRSLRELESRPDSDITSAYSRFGVELGANVLRPVNFAIGSSELSAEEKAAVSGLVESVPDGDLVFVVGYASEVGDVEKNRVLSSDRATAVARWFSEHKRPGQLVQAVYLGQTTRFGGSNPERNQLVEIWRIRKK